MRRLASEVIRELETRIARLERNLNRRTANTFVSPRDRRVVLRNSIMDNPRNGTVYALELSDGRSHKFYEVIVDGNKVTTNYGRIGTKGRSQTKSYADNDEAMYIAEEQYKAKRKKGYIDIFDKMRNDEAIGKYSPQGYDPYATTMSAITQVVGTNIEDSSESEISKVWPEVRYQGKGDFLNTYMRWINKIEDDEISEGRSVDLVDDFGNYLEISWQQECYLGYNQREDYFVMGFDLSLYSEISADEWAEHQDAMQEYNDALEEWEDSDGDMDDEPEPEDFRGYNDRYDGEDDPRDGVDGWAAVTFKANGNRVEILDVKIESEERFYSGRFGGLEDVKSEHRGIIDIRLD